LASHNDFSNPEEIEALTAKNDAHRRKARHVGSLRRCFDRRIRFDQALIAAAMSDVPHKRLRHQKILPERLRAWLHLSRTLPRDTLDMREPERQADAVSRGLINKKPSLREF
jgi:hypothetical protein